MLVVDRVGSPSRGSPRLSSDFSSTATVDDDAIGGGLLPIPSIPLSAAVASLTSCSMLVFPFFSKYIIFVCRKKKKSCFSLASILFSRNSLSSRSLWLSLLLLIMILRKIRPQ